MTNKQQLRNESRFLFIIGGILVFIGFIYPGWTWILLTPGDMEMLPLTVITIVGVVGLCIVLAACFKRFVAEKKNR